MTPSSPAGPSVATAVPGPESLRLLGRQEERESNARTYPRGIPLALRSGRGAYLEDVDGNRYLDFLSGAGVLALGHSHPRIVRAVREQADELMHGLDFPTPIKDEYVQALLDMLPAHAPDDYKIHFCGPTGANAVEAAVKLARAATGRQDIMAFSGSFHGTTSLTAALSGNRHLKEGIVRDTHAVQRVPFSTCHDCPVGLAPSSCDTDCVRILETLLSDSHGGVALPAAVIMELVQGEGGTVPATVEFAQRVREVTRELAIPLIVDEVQTGGGRTGTWFAFEQYGIEPDVVVASKAIGAGLPVSVIIYRRSLDSWLPGAHIGTFRGNQLAFAAGVELVKVFSDEAVLENVRERASDVLGQRATILAHPAVRDVRGVGLMWGIELWTPCGDATRLAASARRQALERGLIVELGGRDDAVLRLLPPLIITAEQLATALQVLVESIDVAWREHCVTDRCGDVAALEEAATGERKPMVEDAGILVADLLMSRARLQPDVRAYTQLVNGEDEGASLTFGELDRRARSIAATLLGAGAAGERVVVMVADELTFIEAFFGVLYAGAIAVPAYPPLREKHVERTNGIFADARARFVVAPARTLALFDAATGGAFSDTVCAIACENMYGDPDGVQPAAVDPSTPCFLQYTSGSTGDPKGVVITYGNIAANLAMISADFGLGSDDTIVSWNPLFHDMGLMAGILFPLHSGCRTFLIPPPAFVQRPERLLRAVTRYRAALITGPNFSYQLLVDEVGPEVRAELDLSSLRVALNGAESVRASTLEAFETAFGPCGLAGGVLMPAYGLAEATVYVAGGPPGRPWQSRMDAGLVGHGVGAPGQRLRIVDPETRRSCPPGVSGEIWIAGPHVTPGYWGDPDDDGGHFGTIEGEDEGARFFRTGDVGRLGDDGELFVSGRIKDLVIVRGRNYSPADIERVAELAAGSTRVTGSAAFAVESEGDDAVVVALEVHPEAFVDIDVLRRAVIQAVSREVGVHVSEVVAVPFRLPRTTSGKIQRHRARDAYRTLVSRSSDPEREVRG